MVWLRTYYFYGLALLVFAVDFVTKRVIVAQFAEGERLSFIPGILDLTLLYNRGAAFGILQNQRWFFVVLTTFVLGGMIYYLFRERHSARHWMLTGFGFVVGGALGNFVERVLDGEVVDFFMTTFIEFPVFNVADIFICVGVGCVILDALLELKNGGAGHA